MPLKLINPESLGFPRGYANGVLSEPGSRLLFVGGQVGWNEHQEIVSPDFVEQFARALESVLVVVTEAGGKAVDIARLIIYVTNKAEYRSRTHEVGQRYRALMGKHFPAMVLVEVTSLLDDAAQVEIEAIAVLSN